MYKEEQKAALMDVCQIEKDLVCALKTAVSHGVFSKEVDGKELGELVDMVKDMAETKRNCWEACYYESVVEAMEEHDFEDENAIMESGRRGYNRNRRSSGRYAPSGTGDMTAGYMPYLDKMDRMRGNMNTGAYPLHYDDGVAGYNGSGNGRMKEYQYGKAFGEYEDARRHYTESKSLEDKNHMNDKALEHVNQSMMTLREIWKNADPAIKKDVSSSISALAAEFKTV